jgi:hypothetical protein
MKGFQRIDRRKEVYLVDVEWISKTKKDLLLAQIKIIYYQITIWDLNKDQSDLLCARAYSVHENGCILRTSQSFALIPTLQFLNLKEFQNKLIRAGWGAIKKSTGKLVLWGIGQWNLDQTIQQKRTKLNYCRRGVNWLLKHCCGTPLACQMPL